MSQDRPRVPLSDLVDLLVTGETLPLRVLDDRGRLLLNAGHLISAHQLQALLERGASVDAEDAAALRRARRGEGEGPGGAQRTRTLFDRWEDATWALDHLLRRLGEPDGQRAELEALAVEHIARVDRDVDVSLFIAVRQDDRRFALYSLSHSLHTATLCLLAGRLLGWAPARCHQVVLAALAMNASIVEFQARMAEQIDPPTRRQLETIREHPTRSVELLRRAGLDDAEVLQAVQDHHEHTGGYPRGTADVGEMARLLRAADVFMAKISPRAQRKAMLPQLAARQLFESEGGPLAAALIRAVGIYPPGDFVRLKNGETAIVTRRARPGHALEAVALLDARGRPSGSDSRRDTSRAEFGITGPVADRSGLPRVLPEQVYGLLPPT